MNPFEGLMICAKVEKVDVYNWTDPVNGQIKPLRSLKVLLAHGDGTVTRESISIPANLPEPRLQEGKVYALPCTLAFSKKRQRIEFALRSDVEPRLSPDIGS